MPSAAAVPEREGEQRRRWSFDAWMFARRGTPSLGLGGLGPSYGASQAGLLARYRLDAGRAATTAYLRASAALTGTDENELALGLSAGLVPQLPVQMMAEARVRDARGGNRVRPAVALVSTLAPVALAHGMEAEIYAAAGYVGGADATGFFDFQGLAERPVSEGSGPVLRLGGGLWSGGQEGAQRVDIGPRVSLAASGGGAGVRLAADYRFRVAGNAEPGSGPALTISAGF